MEGNPVRKALACFAAVAFIVTVAGSASAQVTKEDASCRATIAKNGGKHGSTTGKAIAGCIKTLLKTPANSDCTVPGTYDTKGKVSGNVAKVTAGIAGKCTDAGNPAALTEFSSAGACPSPGSGTGATFTSVATCTHQIAQQMQHNLYHYVLMPDYVGIAADKETSKCANTIAKNVNKLWSTVNKSRAKCQNTSDKEAGSYDYTQTGADCSGKIAGAITTASGAIDAACNDAAGLSNADRAKLNSCSQQTAGLGTCITDAVVKNAQGTTATEYEYAGECPTEVRIEVNSGTGVGGRLTKTQLDAGWTGLGHGADVVDGFVGRVNLNCSDNSCGSCAVTSNCEAGNCRCSNNARTVCGAGTGPFTQDACGAGNTCIVHFGPPLALSAGGNPTCVSNTINQEVNGTADVGDGTSSTVVNDIAKVFTGISQSKPCPTCSGVSIGVAGTCSGGVSNGLSCTTNAIHPDFGNVSYDCQPALASNISGAGLKVNLTLTDGAVSLAPGEQCEDGILGNCWCGVCSGDSTVTCNSDATCAGMALGTCGKGSGANRHPNNCGDLTCEDQGGEQGECSGDSDLYCSGLVRKDGGGVITCSTDLDCDALDSECPSNDCGNCTLSQDRRCFLNPIDARGTAGQDGAVLVSTFCSGPTSSSGINAAGGIPGPGRVVIDWDFTGYCDDGVTEFELGGSNCP